MNRAYHTLIGWWLDPVVQIFTPTLAAYRLEQTLRGLGFTDTDFDDVLAGATLVAQSGFSARQVEEALNLYARQSTQ